jgi:hypothetical protein
MYSWFQCDRMLLQRHETVSPSSQPTDRHKKTAARYSISSWIVVLVLPPQLSSCCLFNLILLVQPKSHYGMLAEPSNEFARPMPCSWWIVGLATSWTSPVSMWVIRRREYQLPICEEQHETVGNHIYSSWDWPQVQNFWRGWLDFLHELWLPGHHTFETINSHASDMRLYQWDLQIMRWWRDIRSADHEVVARIANHGSRRHFVRLVLWARPIIFGGEREGGNFWSRWLSLLRHIYEYMNKRSKFTSL